MLRPSTLLPLSRALNPWVLFGLALLLRLAAFGLYYFVYTTPGGVPPSPLGNDPYEFLGLELLNADLSDSNFAYRPPLLPLFVAAVYRLGSTLNPLAVVLVQNVISAAMCLLAHRLAQDLGLGSTEQGLAAVITALDPASIAVAQIFMAETLANFFIALSLIFLARLLKDGRLRDAAASGGALALATLARPNPLYFVLPALLALAWLRPRWPARAVLMLAVFLIGVGPWYARNYLYHGLVTFATNGNFNLLFYKGVSVEYWATGRPPSEIEADFSYEVERRLGVAEARATYDANAMWRYLVPADPTVDRVLREMALETYLAHPHVYLLLLPVTLVKLVAFTEAYAVFGPLRWVDLAFNVLLAGLAALGAVTIVRQKRWQWVAVLVLPVLYYLAVPAVTGGVQDTRARTNVTVCFAILAAAAICWLWRLWRDRTVPAPAAHHLPRP